MKIYYVGKNKPSCLDDYGDILFCEYEQCNQMKLMELAGDCDLLLIEIMKENIGKVIKWIFCLHCKEEIPILAIIKGCSTADKLKLVRFGITDYIDAKCNLIEFQDKMNTMLRIVKWKRHWKAKKSYRTLGANAPTNCISFFCFCRKISLY